MKYESKVNFAEMTDEALIDLKNNLEMEYGTYVHEYVDEVAELKKMYNIDLKSPKGIRKIKKLAKKYVKMTDGLDDAIDLVNEELAKRDNYYFERGFYGKKYYKDISEEEFFEKEALKTLKFKQSINAVEDDEE